jgi:hypothetical protein
MCCLAQLKIVTWQNEEVASDALSIHGYEHYEATDYALAAWYPRRPRALGAPEDAAGTSGRSSDFTKWWADGDEPLYYIISSKVHRRPLRSFHLTESSLHAKNCHCLPWVYPCRCLSLGTICCVLLMLGEHI